MKSDNYCDISALSKICGLINTMAQMRGATITDSLAIELECAAERLDLYVSDLIKCSRETYTVIYDPEHQQRLIDLLNECPEKVVKAHEGSEDSPPSPQPADQ
jgi:hypothetical protein